MASEWSQRRKGGNVVDVTNEPSLFSQAHTVTAMVVIGCGLLYVSMSKKLAPSTPEASREQDIRRGLLGSVIFLVGFCTIHLPSGPFIRPHPAIWRLLLSLTLIYEVVLVFLLFQDESNVRSFLRLVDPNLGVPLEERDYGGNCRIYDETIPDDPWHNVKDKMDVFVIAHFLGWLVRALAFRDLVMCLMCSAGFELMEYTLQEQLPNFTECWWDHWILDFLICNGLGIVLGLWISNYLTVKQREWRGVKDIAGIRAKARRVLLQFTPHHWIDFQWRPLSTFRRFLAYLIVVFGSLLIETGTFYMKATLWVPPDHVLCFSRLSLCVLSGMVAMREIFELIDNRDCKRLGIQTWVLLSILFTEAVLVLKFGGHIVSRPIPPVMIAFWATVTLSLCAFSILYFYLLPKCSYNRAQTNKKRKSR